MKISALGILIFFIISSPLAVAIAQTEKPILEKEFTVSPSSNLEVRTSGGSIEVFSHAGSTVKVAMYLRVQDKNIGQEDAEAKEILDGFKINITQSVNTVSATAERENMFKRRNISISFKILVPVNISCTLNTSGGSITLQGVNGSQRVETSGGSITLKDIEGNTKAHTSGGSIYIQQYSGILSAVTSGGSIKLKEAKGELSVHTSGGNIDIENIRGSLEGETSGGSIHADLLALEKNVMLETSGGNISVVVPKGLGLNLNLTGNRVNVDLTNFSGEAHKDKVKGSINGGGILVDLSTSGGNVSLKYR